MASLKKDIRGLRSGSRRHKLTGKALVAYLIDGLADIERRLETLERWAKVHHGLGRRPKR